VSLSFLAGFVLLASVNAVDETPIDPTLFKPEVTRILNREFESIVEFTPGHKSVNGELNLPPRVESFLIEFGPVTQNFPFTIRQVRPIGQMQLIDDGILNRGRIFSIGKSRDGKSMVKSLPTEFFFQSDSTEVNKIREKVVFFDDFNGDAGDFDERRWNVAFSACSLAKTANFPVNNQKHLHTQVGAFSTACPNDFLTGRSRAVFDFTDRTGTIFLDHDAGSFVGHEFFLDVTAEGAPDLVLGKDEKNVVRVKLDNSQLEVQQILPDGSTVVLDGSQQNLFLRGDETYSVTNVRRPWVMEINKNAMSLDINGVRVLDNIQFKEPLEFERANIVLTHRGVNTLQEGHHAVTMHLDNIGFDGPKPELQTLNYRNVQQKQFKSPSNNDVFTIDIPESDTNTVGGKARLQFSSQLRRNFNGNTVVLNGKEINFPAPEGNPGLLDPVNTVIEVDAADVAGRVNRIVFPPQLNGGDDGFFGNVHIELDFACNEGVEVDQREFSIQPSQPIFASSFPISFNCDQEILARPVLELVSINNRAPVARSLRVNNVRRRIGFGRRSRNIVVPVASGEIRVNMFSDRQLRHNGGSNGLQTLQVLVDCQVVKEVDLGGAAFQVLDFPVDVNVVGPGTKEVFLRVVDNAGRSSTLGLDTQVGRSPEEEIYDPLVVVLGRGRASRQRPNCKTEEIFIGGDCEDIAVFTEGVQALSVCDAVPTVNTEFVRAAENPNGRRILSTKSTGRRVPPRSELTNGYRRMGGYVGDWEEKGIDVPTYVDPNAPAFNATKCDPVKFEACAKGFGAAPPKAAWGNKGTGPGGIKHWIERDEIDAFEMDPVDATLELELAPKRTTTAESMEVTGKAAINRAAYQSPSAYLTLICIALACLLF